MNPIAQDKNAGSTTQHQIEHDVTMPIDEEIDIGMRLQVILGIEHQWFFVLAHILRFTTILAFQTTMLRPSQAA